MVKRISKDNKQTFSLHKVCKRHIKKRLAKKQLIKGLVQKFSKVKSLL